ncbi:MAG: GntR family transcriptional regulator [Deltaproteobacteria bacterium]|nr:MAG: GntR family transcriptional regulator [Deltaproteobacteria bacterium]
MRFDIENHQTLRERIVDTIREAIINGILKPGTKISEPELAERFGISRTPIREALRQLESEGFITVIPRKGAVVSKLSRKDVEEFYELKSILEGYAARKAVEKITDEDISHMENVNRQLEKLTQKGDLRKAYELHNEFHDAFVRICGNEKLYRIIQNLVRQFQRFRMILSVPGKIEGSIEQHWQIIDAFKKRDPDLVEKLVRENALYGQNLLLQEFEKEQEG